MTGIRDTKGSLDRLHVPDRNSGDTLAQGAHSEVQLRADTWRSVMDRCQTVQALLSARNVADLLANSGISDLRMAPSPMMAGADSRLVWCLVTISSAPAQ